MSAYTGLLLCGGESRRMGIDKAMIGVSSTTLAGPGHSTSNDASRPLFKHLLETYFASESVDKVIVSARNVAQAERIRGALGPAHEGQVIVVDDVETFGQVGPATGILTAHAKYPDRTLCVLAVDFPKADNAALEELMRGHEAMRDSPVTCFMHVEDGHPEPLMSIWEPDALRALYDNVKLGKSGPCFTAKQLWNLRNPLKGMILNHGLVKPTQSIWVQDTDTQEEWRKAFGALPESV